MSSGRRVTALGKTQFRVVTTTRGSQLTTCQARPIAGANVPRVHRVEPGVKGGHSAWAAPRIERHSVDRGRRGRLASVRPEHGRNSCARRYELDGFVDRAVAAAACSARTSNLLSSGSMSRRSIAADPQAPLESCHPYRFSHDQRRQRVDQRAGRSGACRAWRARFPYRGDSRNARMFYMRRLDAFPAGVLIIETNS